MTEWLLCYFRVWDVRSFKPRPVKSDTALQTTFYLINIYAIRCFGAMLRIVTAKRFLIKWYLQSTLFTFLIKIINFELGLAVLTF